MVNQPLPQTLEDLLMSYPDYRLYGMADIPAKHKWFRIGAAWKKPDGSISIHVESIPINFNGQAILHIARQDDNDTNPDEEIPFK
jgi:hypothetical protein